MAGTSLLAEDVRRLVTALGPPAGAVVSSGIGLLYRYSMKGRPIDGGGFVTHGGDRGLADRVTAVAVYTARLSSDHETYGALASIVVLLHWL